MGSKGGSGGGGSGGDTTLRYAPYLEDYHGELLRQALAETNALKTGLNPYESIYTDMGTTLPLSTVVLSNSFFGSGYGIDSYPPLWDMYGKFQAGLDVESLWEQIYDSMVNDPVLGAVIEAEDQYLEDDLDQVALPKIRAGMRDMGAVMSSSFIDAVTFMQANKQKTISKFSATMKERAWELTLNRWAKHLEWNTGTITQYMRMMELYWARKFDLTHLISEIGTKYLLWDYTALDQLRAMVGTLNGAAAATQMKGESTAARAVSGALGGAAMGAFLLPEIFPATAATYGMYGEVATAASAGLTGPMGAAIGGLIGLGMSFL